MKIRVSFNVPIVVEVEADDVYDAIDIASEKASSILLGDASCLDIEFVEMEEL